MKCHCRLWCEAKKNIVIKAARQKKKTGKEVVLVAKKLRRCSGSLDGGKPLSNKCQGFYVKMLILKLVWLGTGGGKMFKRMSHDRISMRVYYGRITGQSYTQIYEEKN